MSVELNVGSEAEIMTLKLPENSTDSGLETSEVSTNKGEIICLIIPFEPLIIDDDGEKVEVVLQSSAFEEVKGRVCNYSTIHGSENKGNDITDGKASYKLTNNKKVLRF